MPDPSYAGVYKISVKGEVVGDPDETKAILIWTLVLKGNSSNSNANS